MSIRDFLKPFGTGPCRTQGKQEAGCSLSDESNKMMNQKKKEREGRLEDAGVCFNFLEYEEHNWLGEQTGGRFVL